MTMIVKWNEDKPHRCPNCNAILVTSLGRGSLDVFVCCKCRTEFAKYPRLVTILNRFCWPLVVRKGCELAGSNECMHQNDWKPAMGFEDLTEREQQMLKEHEAREHERRMEDPEYARGWHAAEQRLNCEMAVHALLMATLAAEAKKENQLSLGYVRNLLRTYGIDVDEKLEMMKPMFPKRDPFSMVDVKEVVVDLRDD